MTQTQDPALRQSASAQQPGPLSRETTPFSRGKERFPLTKHRAGRAGSHLRGRALQQHRVQGDGGEHAGFTSAGLGLHDEICKEPPQRSPGNPRGIPRPSPGPPAHQARSAPAGSPSAAPATACGTRPPPTPPAPAPTAAATRSRTGRRAPARPVYGTGPQSVPPRGPPSWGRK